MEEYIMIEQLSKGMLVKTLRDGYVPIEYISTRKIINPLNDIRTINRMYRIPKENYSILTDDLYITGGHSILVCNILPNDLTNNEIRNIKYCDNMQRLLTYINKKAETLSGNNIYTIYHLALKNNNKDKSYGIYANGLLVESCSINKIKD
jgi:hypothetical protein